MFLKAIDKGDIENVPAPEIAKKYWNLHPEARIRDVVLVVRADEAMHRNVNHIFSNEVITKNK
jgi:ubiquinol oxidase